MKRFDKMYKIHKGRKATSGCLRTEHFYALKIPNVKKGYWTGQQKLVNCMTVSCVQAVAARWRCRRLFTRTTLRYLAPPIL